MAWERLRYHEASALASDDCGRGSTSARLLDGFGLDPNIEVTKRLIGGTHERGADQEGRAEIDDYHIKETRMEGASGGTGYNTQQREDNYG